MALRVQVLLRYSEPVVGTGEDGGITASDFLLQVEGVDADLNITIVPWDGSSVQSQTSSRRLQSAALCERPDGVACPSAACHGEAGS